MKRTLILTLFLLLCTVPAWATIPLAASNHADYALGYLHCDLYPGVDKNGAGSPTTNTQQIQICIEDAYASQLTAYFAFGSYVINDTLKVYEWANWCGSAACATPVNNHVIRGEAGNAGGWPEIKLAASASGFTSAVSPRPMIAFRSQIACSSAAVPNAEPTNPLLIPVPGWKGRSDCGCASGCGNSDNGGNYFYEVLEGFRFNTNSNAGAIAVLMPGQSSSI